MTASAPANVKPRAGEHTLSPAEQVIADHTAGIRAIIAERDQLRAREAELVAVLVKCERLAFEVGSESEDGIGTILPDSRGDLWREIVAALSKVRP